MPRQPMFYFILWNAMFTLNNAGAKPTPVDGGPGGRTRPDDGDLQWSRSLQLNDVAVGGIVQSAADAPDDDVCPHTTM